MTTNYSTLCRAQLSYDYLHTNSTTHEFLFGALAELVDNARDASATKINIYSELDPELRGGYRLCFLDDGEGMSAEECADIVTFGKSGKKCLDTSMIGMYGNGLKSGSMRIGNDLMVFTKKGPIMTCLFLSRTFHETEQIEEIIVPLPSFDSTTKKPTARTTQEKSTHKIEMDLILKYSPFKTEAQFMKQFDMIDSNTGTLVIIYNMKLLDSGEPELDIKSDEFDIMLSNPDSGDFDTDEGLSPERRSFRAYTGLLYVDPRMRIYIQGKKVRTKRLACSLFRPRLYKYSSARFKARSESEAKKSQDEARAAENRAKEAESKARNLENKYGTSLTREQRAELRKAQNIAAESRKEAQIKKQISERKTKSLREPKTLNLIFGINLENRNQDGMFIYNCSRLIKMYMKVGPQADGGVFCSGVVGIVDVPYLVLEPTHNKQDFADAKEYRHLQKALGEHMVQYWKDVGIAKEGVTKFWEGFGYVSSNWKEGPSMDPKYVKKRAMQVQVSLQCDLCLKWRMLPFSSNNIGKSFPDDWVCNNNPDPTHNRCSSQEEKLNIPEGVLKKEAKTKQDKEKDLEEEIRKKQEALDKLKTTRVVTSSKEIREEKEPAAEDVSKKVHATYSRKAEPPQKAPATSSRMYRTNRASPVSRQTIDVIDESSEDEEPELEESEEEEPVVPIKRSRIMPKPASKSTYTPRSRMAVSKPARRPPVRIQRKEVSESEEEAMDEDEEEEVEEKTDKKIKPQKYKNGKENERKNSHEEDEKSSIALDQKNEKTEPDDGSAISEDEKSNLGLKVEAKVQSKWFSGTIVEINNSEGKWKVKFDKYPKDKFDKWFKKDSTEVKIITNNQADSATARPSSPASISSHDTANEAPSSSTAAGFNYQHAEDIANGYRTCLRYFLPPQWVMDKESVSTLTTQELATFPLDDFFDHYEKGLRKLVSSFQLEATSKQQEAEQANAKLSQVRKMIAKLLKSINEEFDIDPDADTDQVDELLEACVKQAQQQQGKGDS